jgi:heme/copper-type cytochrome/quinol oxidase subunit 2
MGTYRIFCAEYCGTNGMIGQVIVITPQDYEAWLAGGRPALPAGSQPPSTD